MIFYIDIINELVFVGFIQNIFTLIINQIKSDYPRHVIMMCWMCQRDSKGSTVRTMCMIWWYHCADFAAPLVAQQIVWCLIITWWGKSNFTWFYGKFNLVLQKPKHMFNFNICTKYENIYHQYGSPLTLFQRVLQIQP